MNTTKAEKSKFIGAWLVLGFGVVLAFAALPATSGPTVLLADLVFWPIDGAQELSQESRLLSAVIGGVMVGWGTLLLLMIRELFPREPDLVRKLILRSVWAWFVVDSVGSMVAEAPINVVLNLGFLLAFVIPWRIVGAPSSVKVV